MNILVTLDSNYIYPLSVMLRSLAANCPGSRIDLYVVYASLTEDDFSRMESAGRQRPRGAPHQGG